MPERGGTRLAAGLRPGGRRLRRADGAEIVVVGDRMSGHRSTGYGFRRAGGRSEARRFPDWAVAVYVTVVFAGGLAVVGLSFLGDLSSLGGLSSVARSPLPFAMGTALLIGAELKPVPVMRRSQRAEVCASTTFAFALLLSHGLLAAVLAQAAGSIIADAVRRKAPRKIGFNVGEYSLSLAAASVVLDLLHTSHPFLVPGEEGVAALGAVALAAAAYFVVNNLLVAVVVAMVDNAGVGRFIAEEFSFQARTAALLLALGPIVAVIGSRVPVLLPLLVLPVASVYISVRIAFDKQYQGSHDSLTGLANRTMFRDQLRRAIDSSKPGQSLAVMLIDLDRFKDVNNTLGHHVGDRLLCEVARRLLNSVPGAGSVARFGGDEFALLLDDTVGADGLLAFGKDVVSVLEHPFELDDTLRLEVGASSGIAIFPEHGSEPETLIQRADVAMYLAKDTQSRAEIYTSVRDQHSRRRLAILGDLRPALADRQLELHYQPKLDLRSGRITAAEALLRWEHPTLGRIPPNDFIPLVERSDLIGPLTSFVFEEAVRQWQAWSADGIDIRVAVNISARNLHDDSLPGQVAALLGRARVPADSFEIEITESSIMHDPGRALRILTELREMGVHLTIDDFGTGYSSLSYLKRLPVEQLKVDRSFVANMGADADDAAIVHSTIELAHNLGMEVTAEGVESPEVLTMLRYLGCRYIQGYLIGRPVRAEEFASLDLLRRHGDPVSDADGDDVAARFLSAIPLTKETNRPC